MQSYEYLAVPAPLKGQKVKGLKTPAERYAHQLTVLLNDVAREGWEFWRADCLPSEERRGLTGTTIVQNNMLIFRRPSAEMLAEHPQVAETRPAEPMLNLQSGARPVHQTRREPQLRETAPRSSESGEADN
ncbi:hypothetical protein [Roseinatronobacter alkalisoli]|uniref:DUF4177 domain-containing protein n=1 Tax=Roseinatronobacter alkalisoli TaxID=3028235 RepID=A0ABT5TDW5_9RHOB|nr:hypothetical protein [Roseinatronobacter sp. HJB301]MDD7973313.1 hypothetical protein [Roseinatronobacter sp. HJB301]